MTAKADSSTRIRKRISEQEQETVEQLSSLVAKREGSLSSLVTKKERKGSKKVS